MLPLFIKKTSFKKITTKKEKKFGIFNRGFSLFELLVVMSIMAIVTSVSFSNYPKMNNRLSLDLTAQDIALTIRQAQVYGTTVFGAEGGSSAALPDAPYGVHFAQASTLINSNIVAYQLFNDSYDEYAGSSYPKFFNECGPAPTNDYCVQSYKLRGKEIIKGYCKDFGVTMGSTFENKTTYCTTSGKDENISKDFSVYFKRPSLEAKFDEPSYEAGTSIGDVKNIAIIIQSESSGDRRAIIVWRTGQISIEQ